MRFSISLLTVICIASAIGTVLKQHEPIGAINLYSVYSVWWFLLILAFLVTSTLSACQTSPR